MLDRQSIVVGVDVHKYSHTAVAMDPWGQEKGTLEFSNDTLPAYAAWLRSLGAQSDIIVALEDVNGYGIHLVEELMRGGFRIRYVPAILTERERKRSTKRHKSDYVDAKRVGKVILTKYEETLPAKENIASKDELITTQALDLLLMERRDLVKGKTMLKNQLHALLHQYYGDHYALGFKKPFHKEALAFWQSDLARAAEDAAAQKGILATSIMRRIDRLVLLVAHITDISKELSRVGEHSPQVRALAAKLHGCGMVTACTIMAEMTTVKRFAGKNNLAMYAGVAPTEHSSGSRNRLHTNPFGNRRLNRALHTIALSQIAVKGDDRGRKYYEKKLYEGKTKLWALRCLKRQIVNQVFRILKGQSE